MARGLTAGSDDYNRGFRRIAFSLIALVVVPTALLLAVGVVMLVFYDLQANLAFGLLVVTLVGCLIAGAVLALVFLRREANLSRLQLDFVSKVSHELRTPLTSIRMFVETLRYERDQRNIATCLDVLQTETERLGARINRLLDWGRMEAGRRVYHRHLEDMASIANEALEYFRGATVGQHRVVEVEAPPDLPLVLVDREAWVDAIVNLLTNAHKYSAQSEPVWVRVWAERGAVHVAVRDRGIGIALREHRRVFEKFYRVDDRLSRDIEGSGLGLSIVKHVVQAHGGKVALKSALGQGSVFTLSVPVAEPAKALAAVAMASSTPPPPSAGEEA